MGHSGSKGEIISLVQFLTHRPSRVTPSTTNPTKCSFAVIMTSALCKFSITTNANSLLMLLTSQKAKFTYKSKDCTIFSAQFSPTKQNFSVFIGSSNPNFVRVLEPKKRELTGHVPAASVTGFKKGVYSLNVDNECKHLAIGSGDHYVSIMNIANKE